MEIIPWLQPFWLEDECSMRLIPPLSRCVQRQVTGSLQKLLRDLLTASVIFQPLFWALSSAHSALFFLWKSPVAACYILGKRNSWNSLHVLGRKDQIYTCVNPLAPLQQFLGRGVCTTGRSSPQGLAGETSLRAPGTGLSWAAGEEAALPGPGRIPDVSRTGAFGVRVQWHSGVDCPQTPKIPPGAGQRTLCQPISVVQQHTQHQGTEPCPGKE